MKIKEFLATLSTEKYDWTIKLVKKGIFWICLDEDAYFLSEMFRFKITPFDKESIKVGFPDMGKGKWLKIFKEKNLSYVMFEKEEESYKVVDYFVGNKWNKNFKFNLEDYTLTKERILGLNKIGFKEKEEKNFLLKDKLESIYIFSQDLLLKMPKRERYFIREKIESIFLEIFEKLYSYMYDLGNREQEINFVFAKSMILREYFRLLYKMGKIKNENVYLDLGGRWVEVLKICKTLKNKYG